MKSLPESTQWLRRTIIRMPEEMRESYPNCETLRVGYDVLSEAVYLCAIVKEGVAKHRWLASVHVPREERVDRKINAEAKRIARDEATLVELMQAYLDNGRKPVGERLYVTSN
jgi:hypothetical protein